MNNCFELLVFNGMFVVAINLKSASFDNIYFWQMKFFRKITAPIVIAFLIASSPQNALAGTCWWEQDSGKFSKTSCKLSLYENSNGYSVVDITSEDGFTASITLFKTNSGKPSGAEMRILNKKIFTNWVMDRGGNFIIDYFGKALIFRF